MRNIDGRKLQRSPYRRDHRTHIFLPNPLHCIKILFQKPRYYCRVKPGSLSTRQLGSLSQRWNAVAGIFWNDAWGACRRAHYLVHCTTTSMKVLILSHVIYARTFFLIKTRCFLVRFNFGLLEVHRLESTLFNQTMTPLRSSRINLVQKITAWE